MILDVWNPLLTLAERGGPVAVQLVGRPGSDRALIDLAAADRADLEALVMVMIQKRAVDGLNDRRWDAGAHLYFELATVSILQKVKSPNDEPSESARQPKP